MQYYLSDAVAVEHSHRGVTNPTTIPMAWLADDKDGEFAEVEGRSEQLFLRE